MCYILYSEQYQLHSIKIDSDWVSLHYSQLFRSFSLHGICSDVCSFQLCEWKELKSTNGVMVDYAPWELQLPLRVTFFVLSALDLCSQDPLQSQDKLFLLLFPPCHHCTSHIWYMCIRHHGGAYTECKKAASLHKITSILHPWDAVYPFHHILSLEPMAQDLQVFLASGSSLDVRIWRCCLLELPKVFSCLNDFYHQLNISIST